LAAAGKWKLYDKAKLRLADGTFDMDNASLGLTMALFLSTSNANTLTNTVTVYGDLTNEHSNANGYTTGGIALTNEVWTESSGTITFDCDDVTWTASGGSITARFAVIYCNATVNSVVKPLLCVCLLDTTPADKTATDGNTFKVTINASGVFTLSGANSD
jgi:hypothetical protein